MARPDAAGSLTRLRAWGDASPQLALRVLGLFAQQGLVPLRFSVERHGDTLRIELDQDGLDDRRATIMIEKVRSIVEVEKADHARSMLRLWRDDYNHVRPHSGIGGLTPADAARRIAPPRPEGHHTNPGLQL